MRNNDETLKCLLTLAIASGILARWWLLLFKLDSVAVRQAWIKGKARYAASSLKIKGTDKTALDEYLPALMINES